MSDFMAVKQTTFDIKKTGLIGLLALLIGFGGTVALLPTQLDNAYVCPSTEKIGLFYGGLSSTGITAYPFKENRTAYVRCDVQWMKLSDYAKLKGIDPLILLLKTTESTGISSGMKFICSTQSCTRIA